MNWDKVVGSLTKHGLNLLASAIPGGAFVSGVIRDVLQCEDDPQVINQAIANADSETLAKLKQLEIKYKDKLELEIERQETKRLQILNETMRVEYNSNDAYVRRARPTLIYTSCIISLLISGGVTYAITLGNTETAKNIEESAGFLIALVTAMWGACGLYTAKRSGDKRSGGHSNGSGLKSLIDRYL